MEPHLTLWQWAHINNIFFSSSDFFLLSSLNFGTFPNCLHSWASLHEKLHSTSLTKDASSGTIQNFLKECLNTPLRTVTSTASGAALLQIHPKQTLWSWQDVKVQEHTASQESLHPVLTNLWYSVVAKDSLQHGYASANNDIITDILHDGGGLPSDQCQQHRGLVEVPEKKELPTTGCCAAHMTKQVGAGIPEHSVKAQHHLQADRSRVLQHWQQ